MDLSEVKDYTHVEGHLVTVILFLEEFQSQGMEALLAALLEFIVAVISIKSYLKITVSGLFDFEVTEGTVMDLGVHSWFNVMEDLVSGSKILILRLVQAICVENDRLRVGLSQNLRSCRDMRRPQIQSLQDLGNRFGFFRTHV